MKRKNPSAEMAHAVLGEERDALLEALAAYHTGDRSVAVRMLPRLMLLAGHAVDDADGDDKRAIALAEALAKFDEER